MSSPLAEAFLMDSLNSCYETPSKTVRFIIYRINQDYCIN